MIRVAWLAAAIAATWLAIGGLVALIAHTAILEVLCLEIAALVLVLAGVGGLLADLTGRRS